MSPTSHPSLCSLEQFCCSARRTGWMTGIKVAWQPSHACLRLLFSCLRAQRGLQTPPHAAQVNEHPLRADIPCGRHSLMGADQALAELSFALFSSKPCSALPCSSHLPEQLLGRSGCCCFISEPQRPQIASPLLRNTLAPRAVVQNTPKPVGLCHAAHPYIFNRPLQ